jgi:hypothetical protein
MSKFLLVLTIGYGALALYKLNAIIKHIFWTAINGREYSVNLLRLRRRPGAASFTNIAEILERVPASPAQSPKTEPTMHLARRFYGLVFRLLGTYNSGIHLTLLGYKESKMRAKSEKLVASGERRNKLYGHAIALLIQVYDFVIIGFFGGLILVVDGTRHAKLHTVSNPLRAAALVDASILMLCVLCIAVEATVNYATMQSYGLAHHNPRAYASGVSKGPYIVEVATLAGLAIASIYVDTAVLSMISACWTGTFNVGHLCGPSGLFNSLYESFLTYIFSTNLMPTSAPGRAFVIAVSLQGIALLVVAVAAFANSRSAEPPDERHAQSYTRRGGIRRSRRSLRRPL